MIGKFSEAEFRARISSGEVWRECLYLEESEQVWHKASEYLGAVFPPPITPAANDKKQSHRTIIVIGSLIAVVFIVAIAKGINPFTVVVGCLALTVAIAGLPEGEAGRPVTEGQMESRATTLRAAYKVARQLIMEVSK